MLGFFKEYSKNKSIKSVYKQRDSDIKLMTYRSALGMVYAYLDGCGLSEGDVNSVMKSLCVMLPVGVHSVGGLLADVSKDSVKII